MFINSFASSKVTQDPPFLFEWRQLFKGTAKTASFNRSHKTISCGPVILKNYN